MIVISIVPGALTTTIDKPIEGNEHYAFNIPSEIVLSYSFEQPSINEIELDGQRHALVSLAGARVYGNYGAPLLPIVHIKVLLPPMSNLNRVIVSGDMIELPEKYVVMPAGRAKPIKTDDTTRDIYRDSSIYESSKNFPGKRYEIEGVGYFRGYAILNLVLYPVQYVPATGKLFYFNEMTVTVETTVDGEQHALYRGTIADIREVHEKVDNPSMTHAYNQIFGTVSIPLDFKYVIITAAEFEPIFESLLDHKKHFISANMFNTTDIESNFPGVDSQEKYRNCIEYCYSTFNTEYVLLAGNVDVIPERRLYCKVIGWGGDILEDNIPADIYYAGLDGDWDDNGNGIYGEKYWDESSGQWVFEVDLLAEVYIGRVPISYQSGYDEINAFVNKVIGFETSVKPDVVQLHQSHLNEDNEPDTRNISEACAKWIPSSYEIRRLYETNESNHGRNIDVATYSSNFSNSPLIMLHVGHGGSYYTEQRYVIDSEDDTNQYICFYNSDAEALNHDFYPIHISSSCFTGAFDVDGCLAKAFLLNPDGGAVACIFNSREGLAGSSDTAHLFTSEFIEQQFWELFVNGSENLGKMMQHAKEHLIGAALNPSYPGSAYLWCYYEINLFGDPESPVLTRRHYLDITAIKGGFGIGVSIENICRDELIDIEVMIRSSSRWCFPRQYTTTIEELWPEEPVAFKQFFFGFGQGLITITATVDGVVESKTVTGFLLGPFVLILK